jgi:hypothetical protein
MSESGSDKVRNTVIDVPKMQRLGFKIIVLLQRKRAKHPTHDDITAEYWALRFAALYYEELLHPKFDNEAEVVNDMRLFIRKIVLPK